MKKPHAAKAAKARQGIHTMIAETDRRHRQAIDTHRKLLVAAEARETAIEREIEEIRGKVLADPAASERYLKLMQERGRLQRTIESARRVLA
jgi:uncharacterized protein involved in exopolysaccharide biosynthesis